MLLFFIFYSMKKIIFTIIVLIIPINISASSEIVMDMESGRILYEKNMNEKHLVASTSKIMTAVIALENDELNKKYIVGEEIDKIYGSSMYLKMNEKIKLKHLLYGLLMRSGNDAAVVIANNVTKNETQFVNLMNKKAKTLAMKNTIFNNSHGLEMNGGNISTAYDMAILTRYAMQNKNYRKIIKTKKKKFKTNKNEYEMYTKNLLLTSYKYSTGGKTGYTTNSGKTFVSTSNKNGFKLVIVSLDDPNRFTNHRNLYNKYYKKYKRYKVLDKYTFSIKSNKYKKYYIYIKDDLFLPLTEEEKENIKLKVVFNKQKNNNIGEVIIICNGKELARKNIYITKKHNKIKRLFHLF